MQVFINDKAFECVHGTTLTEVLESNAILTDNVAIAVGLTLFPVQTGEKRYFKMVARSSLSRQYREDKEECRI